MPLKQLDGKQHNLVLIAHTIGAPLQLTRSVSNAIEAAAPGVMVRRVREMASERTQVLIIERLSARLATFVSLMALVLSIIGLYGVVAYSVARRTSEIGVRLALGARAREIFALVGKETLALVGIGILLGVPLSMAANSALRSQLFGVSALSPVAPAIAVLLLAAAGAIASAIPARRATRIDPKIALNAD
jgi:ABC-type antimicrobial peptide transport system permease subunit